MEELVRQKCTTNCNITISSHISHVDDDQTTAIEDNDTEENIASNSKEGSNESNTMSEECTVSNNNNESRMTMDTVMEDNGKSKSAKVCDGRKEKNRECFR